MNATCRRCEGQCCRTVMVPVPNATPQDRDWMKTRGRIVDGVWYIDSPCRYLSKQGLCQIYELRPHACIDYAVDGPACKATRKARGKI